MNNMITYENIAGRLSENGIRFAEFGLENGVKMIVSEYGGRLFGPFFPGMRDSIFWTNKAFADKDIFSDFFKARVWNQGGDRIWIAPEIQFGVKDRSRYWETLFAPDVVDPGSYHLETAKDACALSQRVTLEAYNLASGSTELTLLRRVRQAKDPLRNLKNHKTMLSGVVYAGFEQSVVLHTESGQHIAAEAWDLLQLNPGGRLFICAVPCLEYVDYYEPITSEYMKINANHAALRLTGDRRYKVGFKAAHVFGRLAYLNSYDDDRDYLIIRSFLNNPSSEYAEEPPHLPGDHGYSVHVYNDDGNAGGFSEMECNAQTIGGNTEKDSSADQITTWMYCGEKDKISVILYQLTGISL